MPRQKSNQSSDFGKRMTELRKAAHYTQVELSKEICVSQRMVSYYEGRAEHPPTGILPARAKALGATTDKLLGVQTVKKTRKPYSRLERRVQQIQRLDPKQRKQTMQLIDTFIETKHLRQKKVYAGNTNPCAHQPK